MSLNPFAPDVINSLGEAKKKIELEPAKKYPSWMTYGDANKWDKHAAKRSVTHHEDEADKHRESMDYHAHAINAIDEYLHNPYKAYGTGVSGDVRKTMDQHRKDHSAAEKYHGHWAEMHSKYAEKLAKEEDNK